jgi:V/A-type H+-transporting ATPase subunit C
MSDDWGYINARIRAMRSRLLSAADIERMLAAGGLDEIVALLDGTTYGIDLRTSLAASKGIAGLDEGLRRNLEKTFAVVSGMTSGHARELIALMLGRWEIFNVKTILRGKHIGAGKEEILATVLPFGQLDDVALAELAAQPDVRSVIDLLAQWGIPYARLLRKEFAIYREKEDLQALELALDRAYFEGALAALDPNHPDDAQVIELMRREIDVTNISYALRVVHHQFSGANAENAFLPGGDVVNLNLFGRMLRAKDIDDLIGMLGGSCYAACLQSAMIQYLETRRISVLERSLDNRFVRNICTGISNDPLSASMAISYLWMKFNEIKNLRIISRGKQTDMPVDEIRKHLLVLGSAA